MFDPTPIHAWLVRKGLGSRPVRSLFEGFCEQLGRSPLSLARGHVSVRILHPALSVYALTWRRREASMNDQVFRHGDVDSGAWQESPFRHLLEARQPGMRRRLVGPQAQLDFPVLRELSQEGMSDWVAFAHSFNPTMSPIWQEQLGMVSSWTTDAPGGFRDDELVALSNMVATFALATRAETAAEIARNLMNAYVGGGAADRVLAGAITRGSIERIVAAILVTDLRGFTAFAAAAPVEIVVDLLNDSFDAMGAPVTRYGGEILKFIGDGMLVIFPVGDDAGDSCRRALAAAEEMQAAMAGLADRRRRSQQPALDLDLALHVGEVMYGNVGTRERLDFTVIGAAVNEASRIEGLCKTLDRPLLMSAGFAMAVGSAQPRLRSLGRHALDGIASPVEIFGLG